MPDPPSGLTRSQVNELRSIAEQLADKTIEELLADANAHVDLAAELSQANSFINKKLATCVGTKIETVASQWSELPDDARFWLVGAIGYFIASDDEEGDFSSPIGFEDDVEILNACLRFANLNQLTINVEEF